MPMTKTPLDNLLFVQGGACFFCRQAIPRSEASVEHLVASKNGGGNGDHNCVACCKSLNRLFGSKPLKEKIQIILNQRGPFRCPNPNMQKGPDSPLVPTKPAKTSPKARGSKPGTTDQIQRVIDNLAKRKDTRPSTRKTLTRAIVSLQIPNDKAQQYVKRLEALGVVKLSETKVEYDFSKVGI